MLGKICRDVTLTQATAVRICKPIKIPGCGHRHAILAGGRRPKLVLIIYTQQILKPYNTDSDSKIQD